MTILKTARHHEVFLTSVYGHNLPMISIFNPSIQVGDSVVSLVLEVKVVSVVDEAGPEGEGQPALQVADHGVDEGGGDGDAEPLHEERRETFHVFLDYVLYWNGVKVGYCSEMCF